MKRLIWALSLLILCFILCFVNNYFFEIKMNNFDVLLDSCLKSIEETDKSKTEKLIDESEKEWEKNRKLFSILINHQTLDNLGIKILKLKYIFTTGDNKLLQETISDCQVIIDEMLSQQRISLENILYVY